MTILVDIDNTINNLNHIWLQYINREYNTNYKYSDITHWAFFGDLVEQGINAYSILEWEGFWRATTVYPNAVKVLEALVAVGHKAFLVTATDLFNPALMTKLSHVLAPFNPSLINKDNIIIAQDKSVIEGDILIDDKLETCLEWAENGKLVFMPEQPWNTKFDPNSNCNQLSIFDDEDGDNMNRRWLDVLEYINKQFKLNLKFN